MDTLYTTAQEMRQAMVNVNVLRQPKQTYIRTPNSIVQSNFNISGWIVWHPNAMPTIHVKLPSRLQMSTPTFSLQNNDNIQNGTFQNMTRFAAVKFTLNNLQIGTKYVALPGGNHYLKYCRTWSIHLPWNSTVANADKWCFRFNNQTDAIRAYESLNKTQIRYYYPLQTDNRISAAIINIDHQGVDTGINAIRAYGRVQRNDNWVIAPVLLNIDYGFSFKPLI